MLPDSDKPTPEASNGRDDTLDDGAIDPVWTVYFDGRPLEINRAFGGYTLEEWRYGGKAFYQKVYAPESYQRIREFTRQMRTTRRPQHNVEVALRAKDGSRFYYRKRIFDLFQRADSKIDGTGVGLAIARRVIEVHGGRVWVDSETGQGSTFWIELPASVIVSAASKSA